MTAFDTESIADQFKDYLESGYSLNDCFESAFNESYYIIGTYKASQALENFDESDQMYESTDLNGVFGAIQYVTDYETEQYGSVDNTDLFDPERLSNMVAYINGENLMLEIVDDCELDTDKELTEKDIEKINNYLNQLSNQE